MSADYSSEEGNVRFARRNANCPPNSADSDWEVQFEQPNQMVRVEPAQKKTKRLVSLLPWSPEIFGVEQQSQGSAGRARKDWDAEQCKLNAENSLIVSYRFCRISPLPLPLLGAGRQSAKTGRPVVFPAVPCGQRSLQLSYLCRLPPLPISTPFATPPPDD